MCFEFDARPPEPPTDALPPRLGGGAAAEPLTLTSADGTELSAALAGTQPGGAGVLVLPDVRGLYRFYEELAERFAAAGHPALALDYFGRTAGLGPRDGDFDPMPHVARTQVDQIQADIAAGVSALRERTGTSAVVSVGFCFGGTNSLLAGASAELDLAGVVAFYGGLDGSPVGLPSPLEHVAAMRRPVLGLFGGADEHIPVDDVHAFEHGLEGAAVEHEIVIYPGAPHSFFDRSYAEHAEACDDAWRRVLGFVRRFGAPAAG
jgi:carboxymethylenebutenolidase